MNHCILISLTVINAHKTVPVALKIVGVVSIAKEINEVVARCIAARITLNWNLSRKMVFFQLVISVQYMKSEKTEKPQIIPSNRSRFSPSFVNRLKYQFP